jgi:DNA-binding response OmpR family regulator
MRRAGSGRDDVVARDAHPPIDPKNSRLVNHKAESGYRPRGLARILVVDGDEDSARALRGLLDGAGYDVQSSASGHDGIVVAQCIAPDLIITEVQLPGEVDGFETCRLLRRYVACPIVIVSARRDEIDRVVGLEVGADDYLVKPYGARELLARVAAHLRRAAISAPDHADGDGTCIDGTSGVAPTSGEADPGADGDVLVIGDFAIDAGRREVRIGNRRIGLSRREFDLLRYLAENRGTVVSRIQIMQAVWHDDVTDASSRTVDMHVSRIRERIESDPTRPRFVQTVRGVGYVFRGGATPI